MNTYVKQLFPPFETPENNVITTADIDPAISYDFTSRLVADLNHFREVLGVAYLMPMAEGAVIKRYKTTVTEIADQVPEGEVIKLSKVDRKKLTDIEMVLKKYRKSTTAEAIQRSGYNIAVNDTDRKLMEELRSDILSSFVGDIVASGTSTTTTQTTLQMALANLWGVTRNYFVNKAANMVYFANPLDVASYLGTAPIMSQNEFGLTYLERFLGLGTVILDAGITQGEVYGTARENLNGAFVNAASGVGIAFGMTSDESGMISMKHYAGDDRATIDTLIFTGVQFFAEDPLGVFRAKISTN